MTVSLGGAVGGMPFDGMQKVLIKKHEPVFHVKLTLSYLIMVHIT